jgi:hypothetical protein
VTPEVAKHLVARARLVAPSVVWYEEGGGTFGVSLVHADPEHWHCSASGCEPQARRAVAEAVAAATDCSGPLSVVGMTSSQRETVARVARRLTRRPTKHRVSHWAWHVDGTAVCDPQLRIDEALGDLEYPRDPI